MSTLQKRFRTIKHSLSFLLVISKICAKLLIKVNSFKIFGNQFLVDRGKMLELKVVSLAFIPHLISIYKPNRNL